MILALLLAAAAQCAPVQLAIPPGSLFTPFGSAHLRRTSANFAKAYAQACREGLINGRPLPARVYLHNAPEANTASIYRSGKLMLLEYWFVTGDGRAHVPAVDDLHEAIYCAVHGASAKEQEESGRCLPD